jgi:hypothetical protein
MPAGDVSETDVRVWSPADDLVDDEDYSTRRLWTTSELRFRNTVLSRICVYRVRLPVSWKGTPSGRPGESANGVGLVYVKFVDPLGAAAGRKALAGCSFASRRHDLCATGCLPLPVEG